MSLSLASQDSKCTRSEARTIHCYLAYFWLHEMSVNGPIIKCGGSTVLQFWGFFGIECTSHTRNGIAPICLPKMSSLEFFVGWRKNREDAPWSFFCSDYLKLLCLQCRNNRKKQIPPHFAVSLPLWSVRDSRTGLSLHLVSVWVTTKLSKLGKTLKKALDMLIGFLYSGCCIRRNIGNRHN